MEWEAREGWIIRRFAIPRGSAVELQAASGDVPERDVLAVLGHEVHVGVGSLVTPIIRELTRLLQRLGGLRCLGCRCMLLKI